MGNNQSSSTRFELLAKRDMIETNIKTVKTLLQREYHKTPINLENIRSHKKSLEKLTKQIEKINHILSKVK